MRVVSSGDDRLFPGLFALFRGQDDDRSELELRLSPDPIDESESAHARHVQIDQNQIDLFPVQDFQRFPTPGSVQNHESFTGEVSVQQLAIALLVIHEEKLRMGHRLFELVTLLGSLDGLV